MLQLILFASSAVVLFIGHWIVYIFAIRFFGIVNFQGKLLTAIILAVLFFGIIAFSYIIHVWDNLFTRYAYTFFASWIGVLANIALFIVAVFLIKMLLSLTPYSLPQSYLQIFFIVGVVLLSTIGIYRALVPTVKEYEVAITNLPDAWDGKTIVHISDVHLGPIYREKFLQKMVDKINSLKPEMLVISGDFFDGMESDFSWLHQPLKNITAPRGIYYGFGNHDLYLGFENVLSIMKDSPIKILDNRLVEEDGLQIIGINYSFNADFNLEKEILDQVAYDKNKPNILIYHAPKNIDLANSAGINLQLSGHTHNGQLFPFNFLAKWAHQGYGYGLFTKGEFNLIVSGGVGTWGPPMRTSSRSEIVKIVLRKK